MWRILVRNLFLISFFRLTLVLMLFIMVGPATAGTLTETDKSVRSIVSCIVSYTRWPSLSGQPKLCIYATSHYTHALSGDEGHNELPYTPAIVHNDREALAATCDAIYFGSESPAKQLELISQYQGRALLLTANDVQMKWLIKLSRAVRRISPIVKPLCMMGCATGTGKSQRLTSAPSVSLLSSGFQDQ